jgi:hypothetical protein
MRARTQCSFEVICLFAARTYSTTTSDLWKLVANGITPDISSSSSHVGSASVSVIVIDARASVVSISAAKQMLSILLRLTAAAVVESASPLVVLSVGSVRKRPAASQQQQA